MTTPSPQYAAGGFVGTPRAGSVPPYGETAVDAALAKAASASRFAQRLDRLDEELSKAQAEVVSLVGRLGPVLPPEFEKTAMPESKLARDPGEPPASPLGERLARATERAFSLVHQVRAVCAAVDL